MAQKPRIKVPGHAAAYHVITRVNARDMRLSPYMRRQFVAILKKLRALFYIRIAGFCILSNHYHPLCV